MLTFVKISFLFCLGCSCGWVIELFYRRFFSQNNPERKWLNPGFLIGPWLPLYGVGLCALYLISAIEEAILPNAALWRLAILPAMAVVMTTIEYVAGLIATRLFHVHLWDYSREWGNIQGLICPKFSLYWAILGGGYYFLLHPHILSLLEILAANLAFSMLIGIYIGIFGVDVFHSCRILAAVRRFAKENKIVVKYDRLRSLIKETVETRKRRKIFFLPFSAAFPMPEHLKNYLIWVHEQVENAKESLEQSKKK